MVWIWDIYCIKRTATELVSNTQKVLDPWTLTYKHIFITYKTILPWLSFLAVFLFYHNHLDSHPSSLDLVRLLFWPSSFYAIVSIDKPLSVYLTPHRFVLIYLGATRIPFFSKIKSCFSSSLSSFPVADWPYVPEMLFLILFFLWITSIGLQLIPCCSSVISTLVIWNFQPPFNPGLHSALH